MPAWVRLAIKIAVGLMVVIGVVGGGLWLALHQSGSAVEGRNQNDETLERNDQRIRENTEKLTGILGCLQRSKDPQSCLERVAGPQGPGGASGAMGRTGARGRRGLSVTGATGPRGPRGLRGEPGKDGQDGKDAEQPRDGIDGVNGVDGSPGRMGARGPGPTDEQVQAAINNYCAVHNDCTPVAPTPDSQPVDPVP